MKRFVIFLCVVFISAFAKADIKNINWKNDGTTYDTSVCTVGGDLVIPSTPPTKTGYTFVGWHVKAAKELEYVTFPKDVFAYIDTGIKFDSDEIEYETKLKFNSNYQYVFGACGDTLSSEDTGSIRVGAGQAVSISFHVSSQNMNRDLKGTIVLNSVNSYKMYVKKSTGVYKGTINDTVLEGTWGGPIVSNKNIWIGYPNAPNKSYNADFNGDMYYFRIKKDGVLVLDLIPAKDPDGIVCFYDRVSKTFFYNQGEISLVAGPEVE